MKRVFLTGASSGIGLASAKLLVAQGPKSGHTAQFGTIPQAAAIAWVVLDLSDPTRRKCLPGGKTFTGPCPADWADRQEQLTTIRNRLAAPVVE